MTIPEQLVIAAKENGHPAVALSDHGVMFGTVEFYKAAKKHGIKLSNNIDLNKKTLSEKKVSFGFYNSLLLFIVLIIFLSRGLYFSQDFVVQKLPFTEFYIDYFFESMRNIFEIWKNLITSY